MHIERIKGMTAVAIATLGTLTALLKAFTSISLLGNIFYGVLAFALLFVLDEAVRALIVIWSLPESGTYFTVLKESICDHFGDSTPLRTSHRHGMR